MAAQIKQTMKCVGELIYNRALHAPLNTMGTNTKKKKAYQLEVEDGQRKISNVL